MGVENNMKTRIRAVNALVLCVFAMPLLCFGQAGIASGVRSSSYGGWGGAFSSSATEGDRDLVGDVADMGDVAIRPHIGLWGVWDDNVYLDRDGEEVDDFHYTFSPGVLLTYGDPAHNYMALNYTYEMVRYDQETAADYDGHHLAGDVHYEAAKTTFHVGDRYTQTRVDDFESSEELEKRINILHGDIERYISSKTSASVNGRYEIHDYEEDLYVDYDEYRVGGRFYYRIRPKMDVFIDGGYGWVDLDPTDMVLETYDTPDGSYGDAEYQEVSVGVRGKVGRKTEAMGRVGYQHREFDDDGIDDIDDWIMGAGLATRFSSRFTGGIEASRRIYPWTTVPGNSAVATEVTPYIRRQLYGNRVSISGSFTYQQTDYYDPSGEQDRDDEFYEATAMVDWKPKDNFTVGGGYSYSRNESSAVDYDTERNRIIARAMYNY